MRTLLNDTMSSEAQTVIGLLRHGKTVWNEAGRIQGRKDSPLSTDGARQVQQWGKFLGNYTIDRILSSDLGRVRETTAIIQQYSQRVPVEFDPALREQSWGEWEGKTFAELERHHGSEFKKQVEAGWNFCPPGGESRLDVLHRALTVVQDTVQRFPGQQILLISHEGIVKSLLYHLAGRAFMPNEKKLIHKRQLHLIYQHGEEFALGPLNLLPTDN